MPIALAGKRIRLPYSYRRLLRSMSLASALASTPAFAGPLAWDCDTPAGRFSQIEAKATGAAIITGEFKGVEGRRDKRWAPTVFLQMKTGDGALILGLSFVVHPGHVESMTVQVVRTESGERKTATLGEVPFGEAIPFRVLFDGAGEVEISAGALKARTRVAATPATSLSASCSTGQFTFSNLTFSEREVDPPPS
jgi:hypothetical protein